MQRGGNGRHGPLGVADIETLFYLATRIAPHAYRFTRRQAAHRSPLFQFAVGRGPTVSVQCNAVDITSFLRLNVLFTAHRCFIGGEASGRETKKQHMPDKTIPLQNTLTPMNRLIKTFASSYLNTQGLNNSCLKSTASTLVNLTFQSRTLRSFSLNQLRNLSL